MDNQTAFVLGLAIVTVVLADMLYFEWGLLIIAGKKLAELSEWIAFWR